MGEIEKQKQQKENRNRNNRKMYLNRNRNNRNRNRKSRYIRNRNIISVAAINVFFGKTETYSLTGLFIAV